MDMCWCLLLFVALLHSAQCATYHECIPFHTVTNDSLIWLSTSRNTTWMVYHYPLVLNSNIPFHFNDMTIHFYTETDDFTVCGVKEWLGHYCDEFGIFTLRSEKVVRNENQTANFHWWDKFDHEKYDPQVLVNEFVWWNDGQRMYQIPHRGTWCVAVYEDGHFLSDMKVGWRQSHGEASVLQWTEKWTMSWLNVFEIFLLVYLYRKGKNTDCVWRLCFACFLCHFCWRCYLISLNERSRTHNYIIIGWAVFTTLSNIVLYRRLALLCMTRPNNTTFSTLLIVKALLAFPYWSKHWLILPVYILLEVTTWVYISRNTSSDMIQIRNKVLLLVGSVLMLQYCLINGACLLQIWSVDIKEKTFVERMFVYKDELMSFIPVLFVMDKLCWTIVLFGAVFL